MDKEQMKVRRVCAYPPEYIKLKAQNIAKNKDISLNKLVIEALKSYIKSNSDLVTT